MAQINISEVINVSVSTPPAGLALQSVSNLLCMTKDVPVAVIADGAFRVYTSATDVATDWGTASNAYKAAVAVFSQSPNIITGGGKFIIAKLAAGTSSATALAALIPQVFFGAFATTFSETDSEIVTTATAAKAAGKLMGIASSDVAELEPAGLFGLIQGGTLTNGRCLFHSDALQVEGFRWGYLSRAMSVNFSGANTTNTMHLKQIAGVQADEGLNSTLLGKAKLEGVDVYANIAGRASILSYGANIFFDEVFNLAWLKLALEVAGFNVLAQTQTKLPQTEAGMDVLKGGYRQVCAQAVINAMAAPGTWTSPDTFGSPEDFKRNIEEQGYFIYSQPISQQSSVDRDARKAPLVQIALKLAGAVHSSDVIVNINR
jgi:hypothetical protein